MGKTKIKKKDAGPPKDAVGSEAKDESADHLHQRIAQGKALRKKTPRSTLAAWTPPAHRRDPIEILIDSSHDRLTDLLPIRYGRMLQSPFSFYRGAAAIMAADLAHTPVTGLRLQICGDCHLLNFGMFATPERRLVFDINDFDETMPGPWEWDMKRLAASFIIASRHNEFKASQAREAALACARTYREKMAAYSQMRTLDVWYEHIEADDLIEMILDKDARQRVQDRIKREVQRHTVEHDFPKLTTPDGGQIRIRDNVPLIFHPQEGESKGYREEAHRVFDEYRKSMPPERRVLLDRYEPVDHAIKVVGVGSVGTRCYIMLLMAGPDDPLFLQAKEARPSVLEPYLGQCAFDNNGHRVVVGQRIMQAASDLFLGWTKGGAGRHFYLRQLRDMKIDAAVEVYDPEAMTEYAEACGWALARAHARSGDPAQLYGYLGSNDQFDEAIVDFAEAYADQNEHDHEQLVRAVRAGRVPVNLER